MPKSPLHPTTTPLLIILGAITTFYHLVITPENPPALLFYYVILIIVGYSQGKNVRQQQAERHYRQTIWLLGFLTALTPLFYHFTSTNHSLLTLIYYLLLPF